MGMRLIAQSVIDCLRVPTAQAGILYASHQIIDLIANGCGHIHVYTMNKPEVAAGILNNLRGIL